VVDKELFSSAKSLTKLHGINSCMPFHRASLETKHNTKEKVENARVRPAIPAILNLAELIRK
jgi:hypothetical protein